MVPLNPSHASTALPTAARPRTTINAMNPPCRLVQTTVSGTSHQIRELGRLRSSSMTHTEIESSSKVIRWGRARKCSTGPTYAQQRHCQRHE